LAGAAGARHARGVQYNMQWLPSRHCRMNCDLSIRIKSFWDSVNRRRRHRRPIITFDHHDRVVCLGIILNLNINPHSNAVPEYCFQHSGWVKRNVERNW
jgi:hypothetical protein